MNTYDCILVHLGVVAFGPLLTCDSLNTTTITLITCLLKCQSHVFTLYPYTFLTQSEVLWLLLQISYSWDMRHWYDQVMPNTTNLS